MGAPQQGPPFKRNDRLLEVLTIGVIAFPRPGVHGNLADKARVLGFWCDNSGKAAREPRLAGSYRHPAGAYPLVSANNADNSSLLLADAVRRSVDKLQIGENRALWLRELTTEMHQEQDSLIDLIELDQTLPKTSS